MAFAILVLKILTEKYLRCLFLLYNDTTITFFCPFSLSPAFESTNFTLSFVHQFAYLHLCRPCIEKQLKNQMYYLLSLVGCKITTKGTKELGRMPSSPKDSPQLFDVARQFLLLTY